MKYWGGIALIALLAAACDGSAIAKHLLDAGAVEAAGSAADAAAPPKRPDAGAPNRPPDAAVAGRPSMPPPSAGRAAPPPPHATSSDDRDAGPPPPSAADDAGTEPPDGDDSAEDLLHWVLNAINQHHQPTATEITEHFSIDFLNQVPAAQVLQVYSQLSAQLPPIHIAQLTKPSSNAVVAQLDTANGPWTVELRATSSSPHQIDDLVFNPVTKIAPVKSYDQAFNMLQGLASHAQLYIAEIAAGSCMAKHTFNPDSKLALGSAFKLWVLLALDEKLKTETNRSWDDQLAIRDELKSLPSGELQNRVAGTQLSLREFASKMISISDNTAADHLIDFVGRTKVEAAQTLSAHSDPAANIPWFFTRELFALKGWATAEQVAAYRAASVADKRALLDQLRAEPLDSSKLASWNAPRMLDLEWFATGPDVCKVLAALGSRGQFDPQSELLKILAINPGVPFDSAQWSYIGYKGGSEPGVLNLSWLLKRADGRWFNLVIALNDDAKPIDEDQAVQVAAGVAQLLGAEPD